MSSGIFSFAASLEAASPWLWPHRSIAHRISEGLLSGSVARALDAARATSECSSRFVEHSALPAGEPYESFIARTGCIPTRNNLHDLFNGLMWLLYPCTKRRLNELQSQEIVRAGITGTRGPLRDALTLFDENAALLQAPGALVDALRRREWKALFIEQRALWQSARLVLFGHALLEKLMQPRKAITAHVWLVDGHTDEAVASSLTVERLTAKAFLPLPVLGVPGWWSANEDPRFYDDTEVFRPARQ